MPAAKMQEFLDDQGIKYTSIQHSPAYTAQEVAACAHDSGKELAKTVMVRLDGQRAMAVLPASRQVDAELLKKLAAAKEVSGRRQQSAGVAELSTWKSVGR